MPDHIHVVVTVRPGHELPQVMHSLKSYTATRLNRERNTTGALWQPGYHEHCIADDDDMPRHLEYVSLNPVEAGLHDEVGVHPFTRVYADGDVDLDRW